MLDMRFQIFLRHEQKGALVAQLEFSSSSVIRIRDLDDEDDPTRNWVIRDIGNVAAHAFSYGLRLTSVVDLLGCDSVPFQQAREELLGQITRFFRIAYPSSHVGMHWEPVRPAERRQRIRRSGRLTIRRRGDHTPARRRETSS